MAWEGLNHLLELMQAQEEVFLSTVLLRLSFCKKQCQNLNIRGSICFLTIKPDFIDLGEKLILAMVRCAFFF